MIYADSVSQTQKQCVKLSRTESCTHIPTLVSFPVADITGKIAQKHIGYTDKGKKIDKETICFEICVKNPNPQGGRPLTVLRGVTTERYVVAITKLMSALICRIRAIFKEWDWQPHRFCIDGCSAEFQVV